MPIIDTQIVFDAETLWTLHYSDAKNSTSDNPYPLPHENIRMIVPDVYLQDPKTQATADLAIRAELGDQIRWSGITLSEDIQYSVVIYDIFPTPGVTGNVEVTGKPMPELAHPKVPIPKEKQDHTIDPLDYTPTVLPEYYLSCDVTDHGKEYYSVRFYITHGMATDTRFNALYFQWDPTITVFE